jgi:hypothetical protein
MKNRAYLKKRKMNKLSTKTEIIGCKGCPFSNMHWDSGRMDQCNLGAGQDNESDYITIPDSGILDDCPLKVSDITVSLI